MTATSQLKKDFVKTLNGISQSRNTWQVFSDWLEITAITLHQAPYHAGDFPKDEVFHRLEEQYLNTVKDYDREALNKMAKMMGLTLAAHRSDFGDFLGEIASESNFLNEEAGQFFTPYALCTLAAEISLDGAQGILEQKGIITISEPSAGSGNMILASAEVLAKKGIDPRSFAHFDAVDVSRDAFNMCYIQLAAKDLQAVVHHGNTLSMEFWESRPTPQLRYFEQWLKEQQAIARLEDLKAFIKNPAGFLAKSAEQVREADSPTIPDMRTAQRAPPSQAKTGTPDEQYVQGNLLDLEIPPQPEARTTRTPKRKADVTLPTAEQLDLFSDEQHEM